MASPFGEGVVGISSASWPYWDGSSSIDEWKDKVLRVLNDVQVLWSELKWLSSKSGDGGPQARAMQLNILIQLKSRMADSVRVQLEAEEWPSAPKLLAKLKPLMNEVSELELCLSDPSRASNARQSISDIHTRNQNKTLLHVFVDEMVKHFGNDSDSVSEELSPAEQRMSQLWPSLTRSSVYDDAKALSTTKAEADSVILRHLAKLAGPEYSSVLWFLPTAEYTVHNVVETMRTYDLNNGRKRNEDLLSVPFPPVARFNPKVGPTAVPSPQRPLPVPTLSPVARVSSPTPTNMPASPSTNVRTSSALTPASPSVEPIKFGLASLNKSSSGANSPFKKDSTESAAGVSLRTTQPSTTSIPSSPSVHASEHRSSNKSGDNDSLSRREKEDEKPARASGYGSARQFGHHRISRPGPAQQQNDLSNSDYYLSMDEPEPQPQRPVQQSSHRQNHHHHSQQRSFQQQDRPSQDRHDYSPQQQPQTHQRARCFRCAQIGHVARECIQSRNQSFSSSSDNDFYASRHQSSPSQGQQHNSGGSHQQRYQQHQSPSNGYNSSRTPNRYQTDSNGEMSSPSAPWRSQSSSSITAPDSPPPSSTHSLNGSSSSHSNTSANLRASDANGNAVQQLTSSLSQSSVTVPSPSSRPSNTSSQNEKPQSTQVQSFTSPAWYAPINQNDFTPSHVNQSHSSFQYSSQGGNANRGTRGSNNYHRDHQKSPRYGERRDRY